MDHRVQNINSGQDLISHIRTLQPDIKIIVFSIENKPQIIEDLSINLKLMVL